MVVVIVGFLDPEIATAALEPHPCLCIDRHTTEMPASKTSQLIGRQVVDIEVPRDKARAFCSQGPTTFIPVTGERYGTTLRRAVTRSSALELNHISTCTDPVDVVCPGKPSGIYRRTVGFVLT
jgi:hypothetical protein